MSDDLPSAKRIWELAEQAVNIEIAQLFEWGEPYKEADKIASTLNPSEKRMFETMLGEDYADYKSEREISRQEFGPSGPVPMDRKWEVELRAMDLAQERALLALAKRQIAVAERQAREERVRSMLAKEYPELKGANLIEMFDAPTRKG